MAAAVFVLHVSPAAAPPVLSGISSVALLFSHQSFSLLNCSFLPSELTLAGVRPSSLLCVCMALLGTGLSLTAHFVKSLSFVCDDSPPRISACLPNSRGQKDPRLLPKHLNAIQPVTFIHPSSLASSPCVAVCLSFLSGSPGAYILHLTSNSRASSLDGSPRKQPSLPTHTQFPRYYATAGGKHHDTSHTLCSRSSPSQ